MSEFYAAATRPPSSPTAVVAPVSATARPTASHCLGDIRVGSGGGLVQQALIGIIKAVQARLCGTCRDGGEWVRTGAGKVRGRCRVQMEGVGSGPGLQRLMNGSSGEFKRVGRQGEPVLIHDDYVLIIFFLLCFFFILSSSVNFFLNKCMRTELRLRVMDG